MSTYAEAIELAKAGEKIRRSSWPFFVYLEWQEWGELGRLTWMCGPAGYWYPTTFDPEHEGKPSGECMVGQSMEFVNHSPWSLALDWEIFKGPVFGRTPSSAIVDANLFVIDGIDATEGCMTYAVMQGDPPDGHVRPLRQGEGSYDRWKAEGVRAYALVSDKRTKRLKLDPDLADGQHWTVHDKPDAGLLELLTIWMDDATVGESVTIEIVEMSDRDAEALPDI